MRLPRVVIGMSGGVDSSVSAFLLKKRGFEVIGLHMINWDPLEEGTSNCPRTKDESDASDVCRKLGIEFHTVNFVKEYWNQVFLKFLENYKIGRTTVPDIDCNQSIKFESFHKVAQEQFDADFIATGHYATTSFGDFQENRKKNCDISLLCGKDPLKDQTYFLCTTTQEQLKRSMFPLGSMQKPEVKQIAKNLGLFGVARKAESMGICFVGKKANFDTFLDQYIEEKSGNVISSKNNEIIGKHNGVYHFTIGKRINGKYLKNRSHLGYFVQKIDQKTNSIIACEGSHHPFLYATKFSIQTPQWINKPNRNKMLTCRIQRTHPPVKCEIVKISEDLLLVTPNFPLRATAPGQMCVFYQKNICLGGGEIEEIIETL